MLLLLFQHQEVTEEVMLLLLFAFSLAFQLSFLQGAVRAPAGQQLLVTLTTNQNKGCMQHLVAQLEHFRDNRAALLLPCQTEAHSSNSKKSCSTQ